MILLTIQTILLEEQVKPRPYLSPPPEHHLRPRKSRRPHPLN